jgi:DNA-binding response OmpR family regulator
VLVVDDDPTVSEVVSRYLVRAGYAVEVVSDGLQALVAADARPPDLVVLDLMLPGMHGLDVFSELVGTPLSPS